MRRVSIPVVLLGALLAGCASSLPAVSGLAAVTAPASWHSPLPHGGEAATLSTWWRQFDDPLLSRLIDTAEVAAPSLATAKARIEQARAGRVASGASLLPSVGASASASRGRHEAGQPIANSAFADLNLSWEIDLFGAGRAGVAVAQARLEGAQANWHDARVLVAAEVATYYVRLRACEAQVALARVDAASRQETLRLNVISAQHGMQSPGNAALSRASAAQANGNLVQQQAECDLLVKALVALTAIDEPELRQMLAAATAQLPRPVQFDIAEVPAQALAQRPDLYSAERAVLQASAEVAQREAQRFPRIGLAGSVGRARLESGASTTGPVWSAGPISVSLPVFDGGVILANVSAARARHEEAAAHYRAKLRTAVREVEEALVTLQSTNDRALDALIAADGFRASFSSTDALWRGGLASLFKLEIARRSDVQAQMALVDLQRERVIAWVSLYRAAGGGWEGAPAPNVNVHTESTP